MRELATLFDDPDGNLGRALDGLSKASVGLKDQEKELEDVIVDGGEILEVLGSRSEALGRIFDSGSELLEALSARGDALRRFVRGSDKLARELSDLLKDTRGDLDPALEDLHTTLLVVRKDIVPLEKAVEALGPSAKSFGQRDPAGTLGRRLVADDPRPPGPADRAGGGPAPHRGAPARAITGWLR